MDRKRKTAVRAVAVLAVALAAGHLAQTMGKSNQQVAATDPLPTAIEPVGSGPDTGLPVPGQPSGDIAAPPPMGAPSAPASDPAPVEAPLRTAALGDTPPATTPLQPEPPALSAPAARPPAETPGPADAATAPASGAEACNITFDLMPEKDGLLALTLIAPCHADERVVLRHAGLAVTGKTSASGSLFLSLPAMAAEAEVSVLFADQTIASASLPMPEVATLRRFGVQWMAEDAFQLHALESGADYGQPGDVWSGNPDGAKGHLIVLGDATVDTPMLAQVYTFPADPKQSVDVIVEAAVTDKTCGRELIGETLTSVGGDTYVTDLTVSTPGCDAAGDILVLKNLVPDLKLAKN